MLLPDDYQVCPVGCTILMFGVFQICLSRGPEEGRGVEFPRQLAILTDCTTIIIIMTAHVYGYSFQ
jgi:hypothetical protein